jgi:hypothetical protein
MGVALLQRRLRQRRSHVLVGRTRLGAADRMASLQAAGLDGCGTGLTLDDSIAGIWEALSVRETSSCLLCGGELVPLQGWPAPGVDPGNGVRGADEDELWGECIGCGTRLE